MNFVRSRVGLVGLVVAWPFAQLAGCTATERHYDPQSGAGGDVSMGGSTSGSAGTNGGKGGSKGGSGGTTGGSSGSAGANDAGNVGDSGGGGISSSGKGGKGGSGGSTGGTDNNAGTGATEAGSGGTGAVVDPGCVATGDEVCDDGIDNDCDGTTDCLVPTTEFPLRNGAAAGNDVAYGFEVPADTAKFQCRVTHGDTPSGSFKPCAGGVDDASSTERVVHPFDLAAASDPANDGFWTTEVRLRFANGSTSDAVRRGVYIHSSLTGQTRCDELATTDAWVAAAQPHLPDAGAIVALTVRNPFVQIDFDPPVNARHHVGADDGLVKWRSLRRQFAFSADKHYLVMTRTYSSRAASGMGCYAAIKRIHHLAGSSVGAGPMTYQNCQAIVFNKAGAGYCLDYLGGAIVAVDFERAPTRRYWNSTGPGTGSYSTPANTLDAGYAKDADNLLWRKLTALIRPVNGHYMSNFSTKCDDEGCEAADTTGYTLFLPDKQYFNYWQ